MKKFKLFFAGIASVILAPLAFATLMICDETLPVMERSDPCIGQDWRDCLDWLRDIIRDGNPPILNPTLVRAETGPIIITGPDIEVKVEMLDIRYSGGDFATAFLNGEEKVELRLDTMVRFEGPGLEATVDELIEIGGTNPRELARIFL